jgi:predicted transposase YbfD/YdcC
MARSYPVCAWSPSTPPRPAWCWRKRGVRTKEEQAETEEARQHAKQEAELSAAPRLLDRIRPLLRGRTVSGDALYCQKALCQQLREAGADYLLAVKANQPELLEDVALLFTDPPLGEHFLTACTVTKHGGRLEQRRLRASVVLAAYLQKAGWPDVGLVLAVETTVRWPAQPLRAPRQDVRYFLSSLPATTAPHALLRLVRQHWHIENRLHWPRDVTLGEDACQVRSGRAPQTLAALRNAVVGLLHLQAHANCAASIRACAWSSPAQLFSLLGLAIP